MTVLATHFPTGCWRQPDGSYAGECACGHTFHAGTYAAAKQVWAEHASPKVASDTCPFCTGASEYQGEPEDAFCERHLRLYRKASAA